MTGSNRPFHITLCTKCIRRFERHVVEAGRLDELDEYLDAICPDAARRGYCTVERREAETATQP
jgi:hypothetical protein